MKKKILVIESDLFLSGLISEFIEIGGFEADDADSFKTGLGMALSGRYDLVLLDLKWALLSGIDLERQFYRLLRAPLILMADPAEYGKYCLAERPLLAKPFTFVELMLKVKDTLSKIKGRNNQSGFSSTSALAGYSAQACHRDNSGVISMENGT